MSLDPDGGDIIMVKEVNQVNVYLRNKDTQQVKINKHLTSLKAVELRSLMHYRIYQT